MIETHGPANCAFCLKSYYSACPVQRTKGSYEEAAVSSARHREAPVLPPSGHPWAVPTPSCLAKASLPTTSSRQAGWEVSILPIGLLAERQPSRDAEVLASVGTK